MNLRRYLLTTFLVFIVVVEDSKGAVVTSTADSGPGSLREALAQAASGETITFSVGISFQLETPLVITRDVRIVGLGSSTRIFSPAHRTFTIVGGNVAISDITIGGSPCKGPTNGLAIYNASHLSMSNVVIRNIWGFTDDPARGGAIDNQGDLEMVNCSVLGNVLEGLHAFGGGLFNEGTARITGCTFAGNYAQGGLFDPSSRALGGGIYNSGALFITNSTLHGNTAVSSVSGNGGAIYNAGTLAVDSSTIAFNWALPFNGNYLVLTGGILNEGTASLHNSIIAEHENHDLSGVFTSKGYNLARNVNQATGLIWGENGDAIGVTGLAPLENTGGNTLSHGLVSGSDALGTGDPAVFPALDQRGVPRPQNGRTEKGAVEWPEQAAPLSPLPRFRFPVGDYFGQYLDLDDSSLVVSVAGGVAVYGRFGDSWAFQETAQLPEESQQGGVASTPVSVSADSIAAVRPGFGAVYIFSRSSNSWVLEQTLASGADIPESDNLLGRSVILRNDTLAVGGNNRVYVFRKGSSNWVYRQTIEGNASTGFAIQLTDRFMAIPDGSMVRVFEPAGDLWQERTIIYLADQSEYLSHFCGGIGLDNQSLVAALVAFAPGVSTMTLFHYARENGSWNLRSIVPAGTIGNYIVSAALSGSNMAAGRPTTTGSGKNGAVSLFKLSGSSLSFAANVTQEVPTPYDAFGSSVAISGNWMAVGSPGSGTVYLYDLRADRTPPQFACPNDIVAPNSAGACSAPVFWSSQASDDSGRVTVTCEPPSGANFPVGKTSVNCVARDPAGNTNSCSFFVTVRDLERPVIRRVSFSYPPGHYSGLEWVPVRAIVDASDNCALSDTRIVSIRADNVHGPKDRSDDWKITGALTFSARLHGPTQGKFLVTIRCTDGNGNVTTREEAASLSNPGK